MKVIKKKENATTLNNVVKANVTSCHEHCHEH